MFFSNLIFDLDGTLLHTLPDLADSINYILTKNQFSAMPMEDIQSFIGDGSIFLVTRAIKAQKPDQPDAWIQEHLPALHQSFLDYYQQHSHVRTRLFPGVIPVLQHLQSRQYRMFVLSNKPNEMTADLLTHYGIAGYFTAALGAGVMPLKPDPAVIFHWRDHYHLDLSQTVLIGDGVPDMEIARQAGITKIACLYGYTRPEILMSYQPDLTITSFDHLLNVL